MRSLRYAALLVAMCAPALSAGCGSDDSTPAPVLPGQAKESGSDTLDKAFWRRAGAECEPLTQSSKRHPKGQLRSFDPANPTRSGLRRYAVVSQPVPLFRSGALTHVVHGLGEPRTGLADWNNVASGMRQFDAITVRLLADARNADISAFKREYQAQIDAFHRISADLYALGLPTSNGCVKFFG